eukprot:gene56913-biopygen40702
MAETTTFPRRLILAGAMISGVLLALAVHMLGQRFGLDLGGLWHNDPLNFMPIGSAVAWWLIAAVAFVGGYGTANLMHGAASGRIPVCSLRDRREGQLRQRHHLVRPHHLEFGVRAEPAVPDRGDLAGLVHLQPALLAKVNAILLEMDKAGQNV